LAYIPTIDTDPIMSSALAEPEADGMDVVDDRNVSHEPHSLDKPAFKE